MLIVGSYLLISQQLNIGQFIATEIVIMSIVESIEKLILNLDKVYDTLTSVEKINKLLDLNKEENGTTTYDKTCAPTIRIRNLSFAYNNEAQVLKQLNVDISKGEKVCLQGGAGSGKSTLLKLVSGLYKVTSGNIYINDIPISNYDIGTYRKALGVMMDTHDLFEGSIKDNIVHGSANISIDELYKFADITGLRPYVDNLQQGFEHWIIPQSHQLPDTVVRKMMLTRALIHRPRLLLLEHPLLGLEPEYSHRVREYLINEIEDTTMIVVTDDSLFAEQCTKRIILN